MERGFRILARGKYKCVFSDLKRIFPETVAARSEAGMIRQMFAMITFFNSYEKRRAIKMGVTDNGAESYILKTIIRWLKNPLISPNVCLQGKLLTNDVNRFMCLRNKLSNHHEGFLTKMQFELDTSQKYSRPIEDDISSRS